MQEKTEILIEESILRNISEPVIPEFTINAKDFGATGDSISKDYTQWLSAVKCRQGFKMCLCGTVVLPVNSNGECS